MLKYISSNNSSSQLKEKNSLWSPLNAVYEHLPLKHAEILNRKKTGKLYQCCYCGKVCSRLSNLQQHIRVHTGEKPFMCNIYILGSHYLKSEKLSCTIGAKQKDYSHSFDSDYSDLSGINFNDTQKIRDDFMPSRKRNVMCNICGKCFSEMYNLKVHYKIHTGEKNFICDICKKAFITKFNLIKHYRIHTGEKPFVCTVCNKAFNQQSALKTHYRIHSGEKLECHLCSYKTTKSYDLKRHIETKHTEYHVT